MRSYIESMLTGANTSRVNPEHYPKFYAKVVPTIRKKEKEEEGKEEGMLYGDYENAKIAFGKQDDYEFLNKVGRGRYSEVFKAVNIVNH